MRTLPADEQMDGASVDALIKQRLEAVGRDYQRLVREFSAPAVRARHTIEDDVNGAVEDQVDGDVENESAAATGEKTIDAVAASAAGSGANATPLSGQARISIADRPFALQLIGFYRRELLDEFVARSPLPGQVYVREETFRGRPWFVLIHSLYEDRAAARQASEALPDELGALDLWIRELPSGAELEVIDTSSRQD